MALKPENLLIWLLLQSVYSIELWSNLPLMVDWSISNLNGTNFTSESGLATIRKLRLQFDSENNTDEFANLFSERGGIEVIAGKLEYFQRQNQTQNVDLNIVKLYFTQLVLLIHRAVDYSGFCRRMVDSGLLESLLSFMSSPLLFSDANFTQDFFTISSLSVAKINQFYLQPTVHRLIHKAFGPSYQQLHIRFSSEKNLFAKMIVGDLITRRKLSKMDQEAMNIFASDSRFLTTTLNIVKSALIQSTDVEFPFQRSSYFTSSVQMSGFQLLKLFNNFLLSEHNRRIMCEKNFFDFYLSVIEEFSKKTGLTMYDKLGVCSSRALFILAQNCSLYPQYFQRSQMNCK